MATIDDLKESLKSDGYDHTGQLLSQQNPMQSQEQGFSPYNPLRYASDIAIGLGKAGQGIESAPYNIANHFSPDAGRSVQKFLPPQNINFGEMFGVPQPNTADNLIQNVAGYAPYAAAGGASALGQIGAGIVNGFTQSENPVSGGAWGGLFGSLGPLASKGLTSLSNVLSPAIVKSGFAPKILESLNSIYNKKVGNLTNESKNLTANEAHTNATNMAENLGPAARINPNDVKTPIQSLINELQQLKINSPFRSKQADQALELLQGIKNSKFENIPDLYKQAKEINKEYSSKSIVDKPLPFTYLQRARGIIEENVNRATTNATPEIEAANRMHDIANALTEKQIKDNIFRGSYSDLNLNPQEFTNRYFQKLSGPENKTLRNNLFSPEDQNYIDSYTKAVNIQNNSNHFPIFNKTINGIIGGSGHLLSHLPYALRMANSRLSNLKSPVINPNIPLLLNSALVPGVLQAGGT